MIDHIVDKIETAEIQLKPFPHLAIQDIFPKDTYQEIIDNFPKQSDPFMQSLSKLYSQRHVLNLDKHKGNSIDERVELAYWRKFGSKILSPAIMKAFLNKYEPYLNKGYWKNAYPTARLSIDTGSYSIGAHRDRADKLVSVMFYVPDKQPSEEIQENYGTALLIPNDPKMKMIDRHYDLSLFEMKKVAKFRVNELFSWPVISNSFHGVYPLQHKLPRKTIGYFIKNTTDTTYYKC